MNWNNVQWGKEYIVLGRLEPRQDKNILYRHDKPNEPTREGPLSFVLFESPFTSVLTAEVTSLWFLWCVHSHYPLPLIISTMSEIYFNKGSSCHCVIISCISHFCHDLWLMTTLPCRSGIGSCSDECGGVLFLSWSSHGDRVFVLVTHDFILTKDRSNEVSLSCDLHYFFGFGILAFGPCAEYPGHLSRSWSWQGSSGKLTILIFSRGN